VSRYQAQGASQAMEDAAVLAEVFRSAKVAGALRRYVARGAKHTGMVQDASLRNKSFYHLPDGPQQRERDEKLKNFDGESDVSYDWLWRAAPHCAITIRNPSPTSSPGDARRGAVPEMT
jgi:salicylate hydroxylase